MSMYVKSKKISFTHPHKFYVLVDKKKKITNEFISIVQLCLYGFK